VLRLLVLAVLAASILACCGRALAGPPVFAVVPSQAAAGAATTGQTSLDAAIRKQIAADRGMLARVLRSERLNEAAAQRAADRTGTAAATDPIASEDVAGRAQQSAAADARRAATLRGSIAGLEKALQPVVVPADALTSAPDALGAYAVAIGERYLGVRYVWGGGVPQAGFDCSGFVKYVYAQLGVQLPHYAASQWDDTAHIDPSQLEPGDLVFFEPKADGPGHVGIYVGNGTFIEAPHTGAVVQFQNLAYEEATMGFVGASRPSA
jgi:cell wall-associated NlpC family hydrolase